MAIANRYGKSGQDTNLGDAACHAACGYLVLSEIGQAAARAIVRDALTIFASPTVAKNTARSSFYLSELQNGDAPMTVYLTFNPHEIERVRPLIRASSAQVVHHASRARQHAGTRRLLLALDDFNALGRLDFLGSSLASLPSYGIKPLLAIQSLVQINDYGKENNVWSQCTIRTVLRVNDLDTACAIAKEIAKTGSEWSGPVTPAELMNLGRRQAVILGVSDKPMRTAALPYYENARFAACIEAGRAS